MFLDSRDFIESDEEIDEALLPFLLNVDLSAQCQVERPSRKAFCWSTLDISVLIFVPETSLRCRWCFHVVLRTTLEQHLARCEQRVKVVNRLVLCH